MAKLTINGRTVNVDDSFLSLSPDEQHATVDEIASHLGGSQRDEGKQAPPSEGEKPGFFPSMARALRRAIPFGDRFVAAEKTIAPEWMGGTGRDYATNLENERAADRQLVNDHPFLAGTGQALGGLAVPLGAAGAAAQGAGLGAKALLGMGTGAALGSVQGLSDSPDLTDGRQSAIDATKGALAGGTIGAAIPLAGRAIGAAYRGVSNALAPVEGGMSRSTRNMLAEALQADGVGTVQSEASRLGDRAMLADLGPTLLGRAQGASLNSDAARSQLATALTERNSGANQRIQTAVNEALGPAESPQIVTNNILATRTAKDAANYPAALDNAPPVDISNPLATVAGLIDRSRDTTGGRALSNLRNMLMEETADGRLVPKSSAANLHQIKQELDSIINYDAPGLGVPAGALRNQQGILKQVRGQLNAALEEQVPGYQAANETSSALARRAEAVQAGTSVLDSGKKAMWPEQLQQVYGAMEPGERAAFAKGARAEIERNLDTKANDLVAGRNVIKGEGDWNRDRLATVFGLEPTDKIINTIDAEGRFRNSYNKVVENSQTAQRQAAARSMKPEPSSETPFINPNSTIPGMIGTAAKKALATALNSSIRSDPTKSYGELAAVLTAQGADRDAKISALANALRLWDTNAQRAPIIGDRAALAAALLGSAGLRGRPNDQSHRTLP